MNTREYFRQVQEAILKAAHVVQSNLDFDEVSQHECYIKGTLTLNGGNELHIAEYVVTEPAIQRLKYRYHFQNTKSELVIRWDNAPHHPEINTHPHHAHLPQNQVKASPKMSIPQALEAILPFLDTD